jgi:hypothetical protein
MKKTSKLPPVDVNDDILTPAEAGMLFGISEWAMYKRAKNGYIPHHYMGSRIYFKKDELMPFL